jgi:hypothetical protein
MDFTGQSDSSKSDEDLALQFNHDLVTMQDALTRLSLALSDYAFECHIGGQVVLSSWQLDSTVAALPVDLSGR